MMNIMKQKPVVINLGLEVFHEALKRQEIESLAVHFLPPIASEELLDKIRRLRENSPSKEKVSE